MIASFIDIVPALSLLVLFFLGLFVGSFLNVVIYRLPLSIQHEWKTQCSELLEQPLDGAPPPNIAWPGSHCPTCKTPLKAWHNIPVISFLFLRGQCAFCNAPISVRYPIIELFTGVVSVIVGLTFQEPLTIGLALLVCWSLISLTMIDIDHTLLPDIITLPLMWVGLLFNTVSEHAFVSGQSAVIGAAAGYMVLWTLYQIHHRLTGKEGMGYGDFKLLAVAGAWLGWQQLPLVLLLSAGVGAIIGTTMIIIKKRGGDFQIPFGPYLAAAIFACLIWGEQLTEAYFTLFSL